MLGDLLESSGWTGALVKANVASYGTADSFLKASHITRTRRAHQVTSSSLYLLLRKAYTEYRDTCSVKEEDALCLEEWCDMQTKSSPQFQFWFIILQLELLVMLFVRSIREANFPTIHRCSH